MKTYKPERKEYSSYLDLPKRQYFGDMVKYPKPDGLRNTCGWFEVREMPGLGVYAAAELFDELLAKLEEGEAGDAAVSDLSYGEEGDVLQIFGDGFSVMYVK